MNENNNRYIPINKGHFELDTSDRIDAFHSNMGRGWEPEYRHYRKLWQSLPKERTVREYPLLVDLELSSVCNLRGPMCYTITEDFKTKVKQKFMDFDLFRRVIDEIAGKVVAVRLSLRGEPMLHPRFLEAVAYAKKKGVLEVSFLTNGSRLTHENIEALFDAGLDWITISIDGVDETYERVRAPLKFSDTLRKLQYIQKVKKIRGAIKPLVKVQGVWPAIRPNPSEYYNRIARYTDLVAYNPLIDYLRKDSDIIYEDIFACPQLYQRLVVASDGQVLMCANDEDSESIMGNACDHSIHEIWHGERFSRIRKIHNEKNGYLNIEVCRYCYYPRKAEPNERATLNDREILIENYLNRTQTIGK